MHPIVPLPLPFALSLSKGDCHAHPPSRLIAAFAPLLLLAACGQGAGDPGAGGLSHSEASQLNDAAAMLDANSVSANAVASPDQESGQ